MEQEAVAPRLITRDRAVTALALAVLVCLTWAYLVRPVRHSHETAPIAAASSKVAPPPQIAGEDHAPVIEEIEDDDVPRFP